MHRCYRNLLLALLSALVLAQQPLADDTLASASTGNTLPRDADTPQLDVDHVTGSMTRTEEQEQHHQRLESSLLNIFGMSQRPRPRGRVTVPQHMIELYKLHAGVTDDVDIGFDRRRLKRHAGNTIRSFYSEGKHALLLFSNHYM